MNKKNSNRNRGNSSRNNSGKGPQQRSTQARTTEKGNKFRSNGFSEKRDHEYRMKQLENQASKAAGNRKAAATAGRQAAATHIVSNLDEVVAAIPRKDNLGDTNDLATMGGEDGEIKSEEGLGDGGISKLWW